MQLLKDRIMKGWPGERSAVHKDVLAYWTFRDEITFTSGLVFKGAKIIVPKQLRQEMLEKIHESHLGMIKCKERARDILYWPNMSTHIEKMVSQCAACNENRNSNPKEPLLSHPIPTRPWEKVGTDLFNHNGSEFLLCVDYFSKFPNILKLTETTSRGVIVAMKSIFARHGIPDVVVSDNGPQYASAEFKEFAKRWEFKHITSSPTHAQSNGQAERMVRTIKNLLKKSENGKGDPYISLLEYRNTPMEGVGLSPAQMLIGWRFKSKLPTSTLLLTPGGVDTIQQRLKKRQEKQKIYFDRRTRTMPDLYDGEKIRMQRGETWQPAVVLHKHQQPRSFVVRTSDGREYRRNRKHLLKTEETVVPITNILDFNSEMDTQTINGQAENLAREQTSVAEPDNDQITENLRGRLTGTSYRTRVDREVQLPARFRE
uniref:Gypsy retrotransposon integrase-like protein 1 n=1 Tax=Nothobranchius furzeri TaxID=105023 RepID=A0A8C6NRG0_NOTFU